jgi:hypothetical protein
MLRIFGYAFLFFIAQIVFLIMFVAIGIAFDIRDTPLDSFILYIYLWPLMLLSPIRGGSHGGELFFAPFAATIYALLFGIGMNAWRKSRSL